MRAVNSAQEFTLLEGFDPVNCRYNDDMANHILNTPIITTTRLALRGWELADVDFLFHILQEKDILRYFPNPTAPPIERVERYINRQLANWQTHGYGHWAVVLLDSGEVLGWMGLEYLEDVKETELAYLLSPHAWGRGYATEAALAAVRFGIEQVGLRKIIGLVHPENIASARVLQKCGMGYLERVALWGIDLDWYQLVR